MSSKTFKQNKDRAQTIVTQLSKLNHYLIGLEHGSGKDVPARMALIMAKGLLDSQIADEVYFEAQSNMAEIAAHNQAEAIVDMLVREAFSGNRHVRPLPPDLAALLRVPVFASEVEREIEASGMLSGNGQEWEYGFWGAKSLFSGYFIAGKSEATESGSEQTVEYPSLWPWQSLLFYFHIHPWSYPGGFSGLSETDTTSADQYHFTIISLSPQGYDWYRGH